MEPGLGPPWMTDYWPADTGLQSKVGPCPGRRVWGRTQQQSPLLQQRLGCQRCKTKRVSQEGTPKRGNPWGKGLGSLYQGPEVIHSRVPLARPGKSQGSPVKPWSQPLGFMKRTGPPVTAAEPPVARGTKTTLKHS